LSSHRRSLLQRALGTAAAVSFAATATVVAPASADHPAHEGSCRGYPTYPGSPNPWVKVVAEDDSFDTDCIQAPAGRNWRIYLQNNDRGEHNISIYTADPAVDNKAEQIYEGKAFKGTQQEEYAIEPLEPGKYWFQDDKVKTMNGSIEVVKPKK
jgi:hypothetical protein